MNWSVNIFLENSFRIIHYHHHPKDGGIVEDLGQHLFVDDSNSEMLWDGFVVKGCFVHCQLLGFICLLLCCSFVTSRSACTLIVVIGGVTPFCRLRFYSAGHVVFL